MKKPLKIFLIITSLMLALIIIFPLFSFINHKICLKGETKYLVNPGTKVLVDGYNMNVYTEGQGKHTLVFLSGAGTCSPLLDFKSLYSQLSDNFRIVVIEKFGYGFSDNPDFPRDLETVLHQTRAALSSLNIKGPFVLCPHSMSGLEALYWAQKYPAEIEAIIGLDMAVPEYYDNMKINMPVLKLAHYAAKNGITRFIPGISKSDAIKHGTLTEAEKKTYRAIFYRQTVTKPMIKEAAYVKQNAQTVKKNEVPDVPIVLFLSDGSGGTGFTKENWRKAPKRYLAGHENGMYIELDCPHYVHNYEYKKISGTILNFLK